MYSRPRSYRNAVMALAPIAYYRLGETTGTVAKDETGINDGTYVGSPTLATPGWAGGEPNSAMATATVSGQYINLPNAVRDVMNGTAWAFSVNINMRTNTTHGLVIGPKGGASARCFGSRFNGLSAGTSSTLMGWAEENIAVISGSFIDVSVATPHRIVCTYSGGVLTGYLDGQINLAGPITYAWTTGFAGTMTISSSTSGADGSEDAIFDEFAFWNRGLSRGEVGILDRIARGY